jgi:hypothetical protein
MASRLASKAKGKLERNLFIITPKVDIIIPPDKKINTILKSCLN